VANRKRKNRRSKSLLTAKELTYTPLMAMSTSPFFPKPNNPKGRKNPLKVKEIPTKPAKSEVISSLLVIDI